jgi:Flp pilus assembly protein TadG
MRPRGDDGSAVVEFVVVVPMLMLLVLATAQVALALHVRSTVTSAAAEGARVAAAAGADPVLARRRIASALAGSLAQGVVDSVTVRRVVRGGIAMVQVEVVSTLPLVGLLGPTSMVVQGHAVSEG